MTSDLNVLMFGWELPPSNSGGMGVACQGLTQGLSHQGVRVSFILPKQMTTNAPHMEVHYAGIPGVKTIKINSLLQGYMTAEQYKYFKQQNYKFDARVFGNTIYEEALRYGQQAAKWAHTIQHNIIHAHDWMTYPAGWNAANASGKPWIAHVHATEFDRAGERPDTRISEIEYQGMQRADRVICVSALTKNIVTDKYGVDPNKVRVVYNGISQFEFPVVDTSDLLPDKQVVLFMARLTMSKGAEYFLAAAARVLEILPEAVFIIAGSGDLKQHLILKASTMGISDNIIFPGFIRDPLLKAKLYQRADIFVMPSVSEPFGLVALEALANKRPVIMSRQSGVSEVISHALKTDFWDTDRLADQMVSVLRYQALSSELSQNGYQQMQALTWDQAAQDTTAIYQELAQ